ncbi:MAG: hypothetical protein AAF512_08780, partial [Pseudomonadota bacterium]
MNESLVSSLRNIQLDPSAEELADALWLASHLDLQKTADQASGSPTKSNGASGNNLVNNPTALEPENADPQMQKD